ncbi:PREDICTED: uncharacterized protein LOC104597801 isoform X2 [Nelumbo nucifera]|uniref:Uncharacterized protein LOC104597801 isoform X2 n=1 Tax=Nelumbo nucifera TaxID=4432 RepID=A0A1U8A7E0_NELNU|nr:PREDICTED: uncharacterized protein LOC104597801 isoform X2 [Nelumbo nucifera]
MNLLKLQPSYSHISQIALLHPFLSSPQTHTLSISLVSNESTSLLRHHVISATLSSRTPNVLYKRELRSPRVSNNEVPAGEFEDLAADGDVYNNTLRLVECSMFAAVAGLAYFLSNSLAIENYVACFFSLPIVITSMRWGVAAGRKTMVATAMLLLTLSGPVKALTYLLMHGLVGLAMGTLWRFEQWVQWDHHKYSYFSHLHAHSYRHKLNSINEYNLCYIWDPAFA